MSRTGPAFDVADSRVEERSQVFIGKIGRGGEPRLTAAFPLKARTPRVGNPDLHWSQASLAKGGASLANSGRT
jgi:hypothetical protein